MLPHKKILTELPYLFFWGHQPKKNGAIHKSCLSQWFPSPIYGNNVVYPTAEHYMMAEKARLFNDEHIRQQIVAAPSPQEAKTLGRSIKNFNEEIWKQHRYDIALKVTREKFLHNNNLRAFLYSTRGSLLVEASPTDTIWGIGLSADNPDARMPEKWRGLNLLGKALTHVREELYSHAIVLPISEQQWLEFDFCKSFDQLDEDNLANTPIWFVNHNEPRYDIYNYFPEWKKDLECLKNIVTTALINSAHNIITINLQEWAAWSSDNTAPTITITYDIAQTWLKHINYILKHTRSL